MLSTVVSYGGQWAVATRRFNLIPNMKAVLKTVVPSGASLTEVPPGGIFVILPYPNSGVGPR